METSSPAYTVRVLWEGDLLQEDVTFSDEQEHTAYARFDSAVSLYRRSDSIDGGVSVQLFDASGAILAETFIA